MTCIVGVKEGDRLWIGGDSAAASADGEICSVAIPKKVFAVGEYLVGFTISWRAGQVLNHQVEWPSPPAEYDLEEFLVCEVVPRLQQALSGEDLQIPPEFDRAWQFMIGLRGELATIAVDFSVGVPRTPYLSIGSGRHNAYGALHALADSGLGGEEKTRKALEAAACFTRNVRPPFVILSSQPA
jgi:ATP-dependent protease HslVU (ClpYQ) peptidase subunit